MLFFYFFITAFATTLAGSVRSNGETNLTTTDLTVTALDGKQTGYLKEILLNQELSQKVQLVQNVVQVMNDVQILKQDVNRINMKNLDLRSEVFADVQTLKEEDNRRKTENVDLRTEVMTVVQTLKQEVNRLKTEHLDLRTEVMTDVQTLKQEVNRLKTENLDLRTEVMSDSQTLKQKVNRLETENVHLRREVGNMSSKVEEISLRTLQCSEQTTPAVAFYAYFSNSFKALSAKKTFVFDAVETNIGKGYNRRTGIFTAPSSGVFAFTWTIHAAGVHLAGSSGDYGDMAATIVHNGVTKGSILADTETNWDDAASTGFVILNVKKGDRIQIVSHRDGQGAFHSSPDNGRTSFAGYRIA